MKKFKLLFACALLLSLGLQSQNVEIEPFASGLTRPVNIQNAGDERLFVVEQEGLIKILDINGNANATPFLDISDRISCCGERGLLGLAFHPDYENNGFFFVNYTDDNGDTQVSRFSVDPSDPDLALANSELPIIDYSQPFSNHNGGCLAFGPDGYLYISSGDGGDGGDPGNRAQNTELLLGKLLRIDIDNPVPGGANYSIPSDNPFANDPPNAPEIWAYGLRNPWKFSFDSANGDIWIGDVGQGDVEEIDRAGSAEAGLNYGWRCYEGSEPFNTAGCPDPSTLEFPIAEYSSSTGSGNCSITGGNVYRGGVYPDLVGRYFFADVCSGLIGSVDQSGNLVEHGNFSGAWVSFGEDNTGQLYISNLGSGTGTGSIFKIVSDTLGSNDFELGGNFVLYPNPSSDSVRLEIQKGTIVSYTLSDLKGSVLTNKTELGATKTDIDVSALSNGIYILQIANEKGESFVKKLIVQ